MTEMQLQYSQLFEQKKHNRAMEELSAGELAEKQRHQLATEELTARDMQQQREIAQAQIESNQVISEMRNQNEQLLQQMRNAMTEKQFEQAERQMQKAFEEADARIAKISSDTHLSEAQTANMIQQTQGNVKQKAAAILGNAIDATSTWMQDKTNRALLKKGLTQPVYKTVIQAWNTQQAKKVAAASRGSNSGTSHTR
jgi:AraC-like DNA-binding protein